MLQSIKNQRQLHLLIRCGKSTFTTLVQTRFEVTVDRCLHVDFFMCAAAQASRGDVTRRFSVATSSCGTNIYNKTILLTLALLTMTSGLSNLFIYIAMYSHV